MTQLPFRPRRSCLAVPGSSPRFLEKARLGEEMIDEASRKLAMVTVAKGRAAGLTRSAPAPADRSAP